MSAIPIRRPIALATHGNMHIQKPPIGDGGNSFKQGDLVQVASGALQLVPNTSATATTQLVWGQTPDDSKAPGVRAPEAFFGENHYCFDLSDVIIEMSVTNAAGNVGDATNNNGGAGPTLVSVTIGASYGIKVDATNYAGVQMVNVSETTNTLVQVIGVAANQATADNNPRVYVKIPKAKLQG